MNEKLEKKCIVCLNLFTYNSGLSRGKGIRSKSSRQKRCMTCSHKCSNIYSRISSEIYGRIRYKEKQEQKKVVTTK